MEFTRKFTRREKVLLVIMAIVMVAGAYFWFVQMPLSAQMLEIQTAQADAESELIVLQAKARRQNEMEAELEKLKSSTIYAETPKYDNLQAVITTLNSIMAETNDYSLNFQPVVQAEDGNIIRREISMKFTSGTYDQARRVITRLHDGAFRCQISDLSISAIAPADAGQGYVATLDKNSVDVSLTITYFESKA